MVFAYMSASLVERIPQAGIPRNCQLQATEVLGLLLICSASFEIVVLNIPTKNVAKILRTIYQVYIYKFTKFWYL
jgi:hypothetical protein